MTEFGRYLKQCPAALKDKTRTLSLLKDALKNDLPKFRVLQAAYELGKQSEIECYEIWRAKESEQPVKIKEGSFPIPRYQDYDVEANCCYTYAIRGLNESGKDIAHSADIQLIAPSKPPVFQIRELQFTFSGLQLKWSMLFEAEKYIVQKYSDIYGWTTLAELPVEQTMYLDAAAQGGKTIKYKIRCVCKNGTAIETAEIELNL